MDESDTTSEEFFGGVNHVVRNGNTVTRPMGRHSLEVHRFLRHLESVGFEGVPRLVSVDLPAQTETLTFLHGATTNYPLRPEFITDEALCSAADLLRQLHGASTGFQFGTESGANEWWLAPREPVEVVVHGDFAPYNCVIRDGRVVGVFDFDTAHPAPRLWDVGYAAYRWVPLVAASNPDGFGTVRDQARRLRLFCDAYGATDVGAVIDNARLRLLTMVENMRQLAAEGHGAFQQHLQDRHDELYLRDVGYLVDSRDFLMGRG
jgi:Ser/Thr protein kinase RdoA (MazF antagonist)